MATTVKINKNDIIIERYDINYFPFSIILPETNLLKLITSLELLQNTKIGE